MNVRQVQKSIVPILLLQLIGEIFTFFFVHIIMDDSRERLAVFSWSLCGSLVIQRRMVMICGKRAGMEFKGRWWESKYTTSEQTVKGFNSHRSTDDLNIIFLQSSTSFILHSV
jgi:hypothetical protein